MVELPLEDVSGGEHGEDGRTLVAGVRPEHFRIVSGKGEEPSFSASVELTEWMGADLFVHFEVGIGGGGLKMTAGVVRDLLEELELETPGGRRRRMVARLDSEATVQGGDSVTLGIDPGRLTLFDAESGKRLG